MAAVRHVTLAANVATTVTLNRDLREVGILHKGNVADPIYVTVGGPTATVKGNDCYTVTANSQRWVPRIWSAASPTNVSIISAGAVDVEVEFP